MTRPDLAGRESAGISKFRARIWDRWYKAEAQPWEINKPQPVLVELAVQGRLSGRVLDVGCGTGENTLLAAEHGAKAVGIDISGRAIELARAKARGRGISARFEVFDALRLDRLGETFNVAIDSGTFHTFEADQRSLYASSLANVIEPGGVLYLTCVSDRQPGEVGPRRVSEEDIRTTFTRGWEIDGLRECVRERVPGPALAWLATIRLVSPEQAGL